MTPATTLLLAFSMSLDAFAAALSKGAALKGQRLLDALRTGVIFGVIEAITPVHRLGFRFRFVDVDPRDRSLGGVHPSEPHRWT